MGKGILFLLTISFVLAGPVCYSQTSVKVSDPRLEVKGNTIHISYDILDADPGEKYIISIDIRDEDGNIISANALEGDVGMVEEGGANKQIIWDPGADNVYIDSKIYIKVNVEIILPPKPVVIPLEEEAKETQEETTDAQKDSSQSELKSFSRTGIVLQSFAIPGLGLSRMTGKPHWLRGVAGYGCLAGSITLNRMALTTYKGIKELEELEDKDELYQKASSQNTTSRVLAFTAAGIWVTDIIWTLVGTSDLNKGSQLSQTKGFSVEGNIDPVSSTPLISLSYRF